MMRPELRSSSRVVLAALCLAATAAARAGAPADLPPAIPDAGPLTDKDARAILAPPPGSISLGFTSDGGLVKAVTLPPKGTGYAIFGSALGRKTNYGTTELVGAIQAAAAAVAAKFPGSVVGVGNLGFQDGKKIPWSVSHQAGRDADVGMFAVTDSGKPVQNFEFHKFDDRGKTQVGSRELAFDVERNLAFLLGFLENDAARVQYIFVAEWLKTRLLAQARKEGVSPAMQARLSEVLHQPTDSNPHADHFHVRLFCSAQDRAWGCVNRGPTRAWVDLGDDAVRAQIARLARIFALPKVALHLAAIGRLAAMHAPEAVPVILPELEHADAKVRKAALAALETIGDAKAAEGLLAVLARAQDPAWAAELFAAIPALDGDQMVPLALKVAADPTTVLHPAAAAKAGPKLRVSALALLRDRGGPEALPALLAALGAKEAAVRKGSEEALTFVTCQALKGEKPWRAWVDGPGRAGDRLTQVVAGLAARRQKVAAPIRSKAAVESLIPLLSSGQAVVRHCANRALVLLTGHDEDPRLRPPARHRKHWTNWWRGHRGEVALP